MLNALVIFISLTTSKYLPQAFAIFLFKPQADLIQWRPYTPQPVTEDFHLMASDCPGGAFDISGSLGVHHVPTPLLGCKMLLQNDDDSDREVERPRDRVIDQTCNGIKCILPQKTNEFLIRGEFE
ncbi:unnamed protein product [Clonostachys solani]|uniref:Uncharacterized protein n=1 Tax=Clonostachys solani TaxID=160281 RepID=A0A9P0ERM1_9HYPO|nr:unnamed protein product [Clonostachys solani]